MGAPHPDGFVWYGPWSPYYNNTRYGHLLSRLRNVRAVGYSLSRYRFLRRAQMEIYPRILARAMAGLSRSWRGLFCTDVRQISYFQGPIVVDHDDPVFTVEEIKALNAPNVRLVVVTTERGRERLVGLGLRVPTAVVPHGVSLRDLRPDEVCRIRSAYRSAGDVVVGYIQPFLFCRSDFRVLTPPREMYCIDDLLAAYQMARAQTPELRLWLVGRPSATVRAQAARMNGVRLCGFVDPTQVLNYVANFDMGVYPRFHDLDGRESVKVTEFLGCGVPVVAADVSEAVAVRESGGGILVRSVAELASALVHLSRATQARLALAEKARAFGTRRDWDVIAREYDELLSYCG